MFEISLPIVEKEILPSSPYLTSSMFSPIEAFKIVWIVIGFLIYKFYKKRDKKTKCDSAGMPLWFNLEREGLGLAKAKCIIKNDKPIFIITHADEVIIIPNAE